MVNPRTSYEEDAMWRITSKLSRFEGKDNTCKLWQGMVRDGVPVFWYKKKSKHVRSYLWEKAGNEPVNMRRGRVMMKCGNRTCLNVEHMEYRTMMEINKEYHPRSNGRRNEEEETKEHKQRNFWDNGKGRQKSTRLNPRRMC